MRISRPKIGYENMRKVTANEAKQLNLNSKLANKIWIMMEEHGKPSFWLQQHKNKEKVRFTGTEDEYFDDKQAIARLEQYWSEYGL